MSRIHIKVGNDLGRSFTTVESRERSEGSSMSHGGLEEWCRQDDGEAVTARYEAGAFSR